ncbi:hypothetical protein D2E76_16655 [Mycobacteroides abscessus]|uniref:Uncharacterized protein n=1 Tax=Mycobacteroides abscessus TaxID=36809 RepID=A0ABD7HP73_9MYCO|nr:hypothetical protein [Mycobacteroides abscessus]RIT36879.1 hypothetical protein D2E76_16655 [Mycobacteroides abscessus]
MNAAGATPEQVDAIIALERALGTTDCTPAEFIASWPAVKAEQQINHLKSLVRARDELPRLRSQWVCAMRLLAQTGAEVSEIPPLPPMATPEQIEESIQLLATELDIARGGDGVSGLYGTLREIARAGRILRDRGANVGTGFYLYEDKLVRVQQAPEGDLYATFRDPDTGHSWQYLKVSMYRVYLEASPASIGDIAQWGRDAGICFVCGHRLTPRARAEGISPACLAELRSRTEDDHG